MDDRCMLCRKFGRLILEVDLLVCGSRGVFGTGSSKIVQAERVCV